MRLANISRNGAYSTIDHIKIDVTKGDTSGNLIAVMICQAKTWEPMQHSTSYAAVLYKSAFYAEHCMQAVSWMSNGRGFHLTTGCLCCDSKLVL